ncbi:MAG: DUF1553 domain-containing protein, partial [Gimesia sp.]|nr:DUF1553 domain-containing protein [Gimesia sp.]
NRQFPRSKRDESPSALQPLILFNGLMSQRIVRLSEKSAITDLCLQESTVAELIDNIFLSVMSRMPTDSEREAVTRLLKPSFATRKTGKPKRVIKPLTNFQPDWRVHLQAEQSKLALEAQKRVRQGEQPTARLTAEFRERVEDLVWALINSPEFLFIP